MMKAKILLHKLDVFANGYINDKAMKTLILNLAVVVLLLGACEKDKFVYVEPLNKMSACNVNDPLNELEWLHEIALKSIDDTTGKYTGRIWIKEFEGQDYILTDMAFASGGLGFTNFDCFGKKILLNYKEFYKSLTDNDLIYKNNKTNTHYIKPINNIIACNVKDPLNELEWLHEIALKAIADTTGKYTGRIWIKEFEGQDYIVTDMTFASGGLSFTNFDCFGKKIQITNYKEFYKSLTENDLIYKNTKTNTYYIKPINIIRACIANDPLNELEWLHEIALKAISDATGKYTGRIWIKEYEGQDYIVTDMDFASGGYGFTNYNCFGKRILIHNLDFYKSLTDNDLIYKNTKTDIYYIKPVNTISACGVQDPLNELDWLYSLAYYGRNFEYIYGVENIWVKKYKNEDIIAVNYMNTGGYLPRLFDCNGNRITIDDPNAFYNTLTEKDLVYKFR